MKRLFFFIFLHLIVFLILITSYAYAEEKVFTCKPVFASIQLKNGEYYSETNDDESTPLIDSLPVTQFLIDDDDVFYKNNKNRKFEQLIPSEDFNNVELSEEHENIFLKAKNAFKQWDQMIDLKNYKSFMLPSKVRKSSVRFCHFMSFFPFFNCISLVIMGIKYFTCDFLSHCFFISF